MIQVGNSSNCNPKHRAKMNANYIMLPNGIVITMKEYRENYAR